MIVEGTVEDRILWRLYDRIDIFRQSIGDLEDILGDTIRDLQRDYVSGRLTPEEAEQRVQQAATAINQRRLHLDQLEKNAQELFGHEDYIRDEMERIGRLGRFISEEAMIAVIKTYLQASHPAVRLWEEAPRIFGLRLTEGLREDIHDAARGSQPWLDRSQKGKLLFTTQGDIAFRNPEVELLNVSHPLVQAAVQAVQEQLKSPLSRIGQGVVELAAEEDLGLKAGFYFVLAFAHSVGGLRGRRVLEAVGWSEPDQCLLDAETSERLLHLVTQQGREWDRKEPGPPLLESAWEQIVSEARQRNRLLQERESRENDALYARRKRVLEAEFHHNREIRETRLRTAESRGHKSILPAMKGQIDKLEAEYRAKSQALEQARTVSISLSEPIAVCLVEVRRPKNE